MNNPKSRWYWGKNRVKNNNIIPNLLKILENKNANIDKIYGLSNLIIQNYKILSVEINNLSDFFIQIKNIIDSKNTRDFKIYCITQLYDENNEPFIDEKIANIIYNSVNLHTNIHHFGGSNKKKKTQINNTFDINVYKKKCDISDIDYICKQKNHNDINYYKFISNKYQNNNCPLLFNNFRLDAKKICQKIETNKKIETSKKKNIETSNNIVSEFNTIKTDIKKDLKKKKKKLIDIIEKKKKKR